jgi:hypothetical protein
MSLSDLLAYGGVSFWLGLNLVYSSCFLVIPASVVLSSAVKALARKGKARDNGLVRPAWVDWGLTIFCLLLLGLGFYASVYEPNAVQLETVYLTSPKLPAGSELRLVQLSDLHISRLGLREKRTQHLVQRARPDLIVLTGNYLNSPEAASQGRGFLSGLRAPNGVFAVTGVEDAYSDLSRLFEGSGVRLLRDEGVGLVVNGTPIKIVGLTWDRPDFGRAFAGSRPDEFTILLSHSPRVFLSRPPADLLLAGQSHGGEVGIPALRNLIITYLRGDPRYYGGLYRKGKLEMFVSRGLGMEGGDAPSLRFLARPEVTLVVIRGRAASVLTR